MCFTILNTSVLSACCTRLSRHTGALTCHHKCKCETFLQRLSVNLVWQCGKTHILSVLILQKVQISQQRLT